MKTIKFHLLFTFPNNQLSPQQQLRRQCTLLKQFTFFIFFFFHKHTLKNYTF